MSSRMIYVSLLSLTFSAVALSSMIVPFAHAQSHAQSHVQATVSSTDTTTNIIQPPELNADHNYNYQQIKNVEPEVETLTTALFGDQIDLASGGLRFSQTDVSLPGNFALDVAFTRTLSGPESWFRETQELGNWSIDLPHVRSNYVAWPDGTPHGNFTSYVDGKTAYWPDGRACSPKLNSNPDFERNEFTENGPATKYYQQAGDYWGGDKVYIPGKGSTTLLNREADPTYKRYNNKQWDVVCWQDPHKPDQEGFKITTLDGTRYYFSEQVIRRNGQKLNLIKLANDSDCQPGQDCNIVIDVPGDSERLKIDQYVIFLLITKIEDKFGNTVAYDYDNGKLSRIEASDDRVITLAYENNRVSQVNANGRQWRYDYDDHGSLRRLTLPNGQHWAFDNGGDLYGTWREWFPPHLYVGEACIDATPLPRHFITMRHPYGMQGTFNVDAHCFGQVAVPRIQQANPGGNTERQTHWLKTENRTIVLDDKTLTFPDGRQYVWDYQYSTTPGLFEDETATSTHQLLFQGTARADIKTTTVVHPNHDKEVHYFDRTYGLTENNLLASETYAGDTLLQRQHYDYSYSEPYGTNRTLVNITYARNAFEKQKKSWNDERAIRTDALTTTLFNGSTQALGQYEQRITDYNAYHKPLSAQSTHGDNTRYFRFGYQHDSAHGVYNLPTKIQVSDSVITDNNTGVVKETLYQPLSGSQSVQVPAEIRAFGLWRQRFVAYHTDTANAPVNNALGQPKKVTFNAALATGTGQRFVEYLRYKRGQPTHIRVPARYHAPGDNGVNTQSAYQTLDNNGWITRIQDFNGNQIHYGYDAEGRLNYLDNPAMNGTDNAGQWLDHLFTWSQTEHGSPKRTEARCVLSIHPQTRIATCDAAAVYTETQHFDSLLRPTLTHRANGTTSPTRIHRYQVQEYDHYHNATFSSYWSSSPTERAGTTRTFDALNRLRRETVTGGGTVQRDYLSHNRLRVTDAKGHQTLTTYRAFGSPAYQLATEIVSPENVTTTLSYNAFDRLTAITQRGTNGQGEAIALTEQRAYNAQQQLCKTHRPDTGQTVFVHNALGQLIQQQQGTTGGTPSNCAYTHNAQALTEFGFDNLGDNRSVTYHDSLSSSPSGNLLYTLDANGNLTQLRSRLNAATADVVTQDYSYNNLNLLEQETLSLDGKQLTLDYQYNSQGHISGLTYPDGDTVTFAPNAFGEATELVRLARAGENQAFTYARDASYHPNGSIHTFIYGNGLRHETLLNARQLPQSIKDATPANSTSNTNNANPVSALHYSYQYDHNQNISRLTDHLDASFSLSSLTYDGLDRLIATTAAQAGSRIGDSLLNYDSLGNITRYTVTSDNQTAQDLHYHYHASNHRLSHIDDHGSRNRDYLHFEYNPRGSITNNSFHRFSYNRANQMVSAVSDSATHQYRYDGHNRRVKQVKTQPNGDTETEYSLYSQDGTLLYRETPLTNGELGPANYLYLGKKLIAKDGYFKETAGKQHYQPFGGSIEGELDDVGYTGHKFDKDLGLSYMQARYYDPVIGRFYSNDPVDPLEHMERGNSIAHGFNRYAYANNNPYKYVDPDGEFVFTAIAIAAVAHSAYDGYQEGGASGALAEASGYNDAVDSVNSFQSGDYTGAAMSAAAVVCKACKGATKASKMQQKVKKGQAPKGIKRFDSAESSVPNSKDHVHFDDGTSMNVDGTVHDKKNGAPNPNNKQKKFLKKEGWAEKPKKDD